MTTTLSKATPLQRAGLALRQAEGYLRQARDEMPEEYAERLHILEAEIQGVLDGLKRVKDG